MQFDKQVADLALSRGMSRAAVFCALLAEVGSTHADHILPAKRQKCLDRLSAAALDVSMWEAFKTLCQCKDLTLYAEEVEWEQEAHSKKCRYVKWRKLIGKPLESLFDNA